MVRIAILASGSGSNAEQIISYMKGVRDIEIAYIVTNRPGAGVLKRSAKYGIPTKVFTNKAWLQQDQILPWFENQKIDFIVLAGYLQKIPNYLIKSYPKQIVNIHPALLPSYGGKGMYGMNVHRAVHENQESYSGITIHMVNEVYDDGEIIFQAKCSLDPEDTPSVIQRKVQKLEHRYYPLVIKYLARADTEALPG